MLTAAHCVLPKPNFLRLPEDSLEIVAGDHTRSKDEGTEQIFRVREYIPHPGFDPFESKSLYDNDFAIIKLAKEVKFTKHVNPICLPQPNSKQNFDSVEATASGWGSLKEKKSITGHDILQKVHVYIDMYYASDIVG